MLSAKELCDIKKSLEVKSEQCVRFGMCTYFGFHLSVVTGSINWSMKSKKEVCSKCVIIFVWSSDKPSRQSFTRG